MKSKLNLAKRVVTILLLGVLSLGLASSGMMPTFAAPEATSPLWSTQLQKGGVHAGVIEDSSPTLADLDGDGKLEIVVGTTNTGNSSALAVLEDNGSIKWLVSLADPVRSSPAVADLSDPPDGIPEIIVTTGGDVNQSRGSAIAFDRNGTQLWKYDTNDAQGTGTASGNWSSPTIGDVNGDGVMEVVFGSWDRNIYMLDHNGHMVWHYFVADSIWSTAALADLNKDGYLEIIIGTDITGGGVLPDGYRPTDGGFVLILDKSGNLLARRQMNEIIQSSPAVGDVDGDGQFEIFCGTGIYWFQQGKYTQPYVYGFRVNMSGTPWQIEDLPGWPQPVAYPAWSSPALADLDGDGDLEIIIGTGFQANGALYAWHHTGSPVSGFPMLPTSSSTNSAIRSSPVVADVDNDGSLEILLSMIWDVIVVGNNGVQETNLRTNYSVLASPAIGDLDNDGQTDVVIGGSHISDPNHGRVYAFEFGPNSYNTNKQPWPIFHRDAQHTGRYPSPPELSVSPASIYLMHQYGTAGDEQAGLQISNLGDGSIAWSAVSSNPGSVTLSLGSGTVYTSTSVIITVKTAGYTAGTHSVGNIVINGGSAGSATIPVTLYVGQVYKVYLPTVMRNSQ